MTNKLDQKDIDLIKVLQEEFPISKRPYEEIGKKLGLSEDQVLENIQDLKDRGLLKRMGIALKHNTIGYNVNSMLVWDIDDNIVDEIGEKVACHPAVTHCYTRNRVENFPYNFYTMTHARSEEEYEEILADLKEIIGKDTPFYSLRTLSELKKTGMKYFTEEKVIEKEKEIIYLD